MCIETPGHLHGRYKTAATTTYFFVKKTTSVHMKGMEGKVIHGNSRQMDSSIIVIYGMLTTLV